MNVSGETSGFAPGLEVDYGVLPNTQLSIIAPLAFDRASGTPFHFGYGDTEIGLKFRVIDQDANGWRPAVAVFPTVDIPTGDSRRGLGTGGARMFQPVWLQKDIGDWTINTGGGYSIKSGFGNKNDWFVGLLVQRKITDQLKIGAEMFHQTALEVAGRNQPASTSAQSTTSPTITMSWSRRDADSRTPRKRTNFLGISALRRRAPGHEPLYCY